MKPPAVWSRPFVIFGWGGGAATSLVLWFLIPVPWWCAITMVIFGGLEFVGLKKRGDAWPPLTLAVRRFVPEWAAMPAFGFLVGYMAALAGGLQRRLLVASILALGWWINQHFSRTFSKPGE